VSGSLGGSDTSLTVPTGLVGEGKLSEVPADHVELDFDAVEGLAVVDSDVAAYHFGEDDGVAEVGLDGGGLLSGQCVLLALFALGVEPDVFVLDLCVEEGLLLENLRRMRARKSSTTFSWLSSLIWSGVSPRKLCLLRPLSFLCAVAIRIILFILNIF
jgi:hypothetical protein